MSEYPAEAIPDQDNLYLRVHRNHFLRGEILSPAFKGHPPGALSTNWCKYSTPKEARAQGRQPPENYGVVGLRVGAVRKIPQQVVLHSPLPENRAHTDVRGPKGTDEVIDGFVAASTWKVRLGEPL